jgi:Staphylococcal nuclease homologue
MAFPRCCQRSFHCSLCIAFVSAALVGGKSAALAVRELSFFEFGHPAVPASIESKCRRESSVLSHASHQFSHAALGIELVWLWLARFAFDSRLMQDQRVLAVCRLDGEDLNAWMVTQGWALAFVRYSTAYVHSEESARAAPRGMWSGPFIAPWDWRHRDRQTVVLGALAVPIAAQSLLLARPRRAERHRPIV